MGNLESKDLLKYKYNFGNPEVGDVDLSEAKVFVIDSAEKASKVNLSGETILYVDCLGKEFDYPGLQLLSTVQVATGSEVCFIFDIPMYPENLSFLKGLFESQNVRKVFHDCSGISSVLHSYGIDLTNIEDTKAAEEVIYPRKGTEISLEYLYHRYAGKLIGKEINSSDLDCESPRFAERLAYRDRNKCFDRPLTEKYVKYAAAKVLVLQEIFTLQELMLRDWPSYRIQVEKLKMSKRSRNAKIGDALSRGEGNEMSGWIRWDAAPNWKNVLYVGVLLALIYSMLFEK